MQFGHSLAGECGAEIYRPVYTKPSVYAGVAYPSEIYLAAWARSLSTAKPQNFRVFTAFVVFCPVFLEIVADTGYFQQICYIASSANIGRRAFSTDASSDVLRKSTSGAAA